MHDLSSSSVCYDSSSLLLCYLSALLAHFPPCVQHDANFDISKLYHGFIVKPCLSGLMFYNIGQSAHFFHRDSLHLTPAVRDSVHTTSQYSGNESVRKSHCTMVLDAHRAGYFKYYITRT